MENNELLQKCFNIVVQPDYAIDIISAFQSKYGFDTLEFFQLYKDGFELPVPSCDVQTWLYQYKLFLAAGGDIFQLICPKVNNEEAQRASFFLSTIILEKYNEPNRVT